MSRKMSRRKFLKVSLTAGAGIAALSKGLPIAAQDMMYSEAPELADLVASGDLPPVADRLPLNPVVIEPLDSIGEYGGAIVLNLPTTGPLLLNALLAQDMLLAGSMILFLSLLTVVGAFVSDLLLVWADPRIQFE